MKQEAPILFKPELLRMIWEDKKTQTRRVEQNQPAPDATFLGFDDRGQALFSDGTIWPARYGQPTGFTQDWPGTLLWVKEKYKYGEAPNDIPKQGVALFEEGKPGYIYHPDMPERAKTFARVFKTRSGMLMYRWAARTFLRHTVQRIERLQEITDDDAKAEGMKLRPYQRAYPGLYRQIFFNLWDEINGKRGFTVDLNPWVRVVCFTRVQGPKL